MWRVRSSRCASSSTPEGSSVYRVTSLASNLIVIAPAPQRSIVASRRKSRADFNSLTSKPHVFAMLVSYQLFPAGVLPPSSTSSLQTLARKRTWLPSLDSDLERWRRRRLPPPRLAAVARRSTVALYPCNFAQPE